jgi:hypothetical protein
MMGEMTMMKGVKSGQIELGGCIGLAAEVLAARAS